MSTHESGNPRHTRQVNAWCLYDWGSSAFSTTVEAAVLPVYFHKVVAVPLPSHIATVYWGYANAAALLLTAILAPLLGSIADHTGRKKHLLALFAAVGVGATALMVTVDAGEWRWALTLFLLGSLGFGGSYVFYDALLPHVAPLDEMDAVSAKGYALGYLGGGILLAVNIVMIQYLWSGDTLGPRLSFLTVACWWAAFTLPLLRWVPEPPPYRSDPTINPLHASLQRLRKTCREVRRYREPFLFLLAFWLYNDGIGTVIKMATIYGSEIGIGTADLLGALLLTQCIGIPCSMLFGMLGQRIGTKRAITLGLFWYILIVIAGYFMHRAWHFWALAGMVGVVQGGTQALSRSLFGAMIPKARSAEFFSFYDVSSKFAGIAGPALFALIGHWTGSSRQAIITLIIFFVGGIAILQAVNEREGIRLAATDGNGIGHDGPDDLQVIIYYS